MDFKEFVRDFIYKIINVKSHHATQDFDEFINYNKFLNINSKN